MGHYLLTLVPWLWITGALGQAPSGSSELPEYVTSECYGDIFSFDCGPGNKIRINKDFFGFSPQRASCSYGRGDCIISNPKSNSLIHRYCTGRRGCTYYQVERRGCDGYFSNYQQVEYQCIPDTSVTDVCSDVHYQASNTYISSPNFPNNYPPNRRCACVVTSRTPRARVRLEIVYMAIKYTKPCRDWLRIGRKRMCGTSVNLFSGRRVPIEFTSDRDEGHSGFWLHFHSSAANGILDIRCGNTSVNVTTTSRSTSTTTTTATTTEISTTPDSIPDIGNIRTNPEQGSSRVDPFVESSLRRAEGREGSDGNLEDLSRNTPQQTATGQNTQSRPSQSDSDYSELLPGATFPRDRERPQGAFDLPLFSGRTVPPRRFPGGRVNDDTTPSVPRSGRASLDLSDNSIGDTGDIVGSIGDPRDIVGVIGDPRDIVGVIGNPRDVVGVIGNSGDIVDGIGDPADIEGGIGDSGDIVGVFDRQDDNVIGSNKHVSSNIKEADTRQRGSSEVPGSDSSGGDPTQLADYTSPESPRDKSGENGEFDDNSNHLHSGGLSPNRAMLRQGASHDEVTTDPGSTRLRDDNRERSEDARYKGRVSTDASRTFLEQTTGDSNPRMSIGTSLQNQPRDIIDAGEVHPSNPTISSFLPETNQDNGSSQFDDTSSYDEVPSLDVLDDADDGLGDSMFPLLDPVDDTDRSRSINTVPGKSPYPKDRHAAADDFTSRDQPGSPDDHYLTSAGVANHQKPTIFDVVIPEERHRATKAPPTTLLDQIMPTVMSTSGIHSARDSKQRLDKPDQSDSRHVLDQPENTAWFDQERYPRIPRIVKGVTNPDGSPSDSQTGLSKSGYVDMRQQPREPHQSLGSDISITPEVVTDLRNRHGERQDKTRQPHKSINGGTGRKYNPGTTHFPVHVNVPENLADEAGRWHEDHMTKFSESLLPNNQTEQQPRDISNNPRDDLARTVVDEDVDNARNMYRPKSETIDGQQSQSNKANRLEVEKTDGYGDDTEITRYRSEYPDRRRISDEQSLGDTFLDTFADSARPSGRMHQDRMITANDSYRQGVRPDTPGVYNGVDSVDRPADGSSDNKEGLGDSYIGQDRTRDIIRPSTGYVDGGRDGGIGRGNDVLSDDDEVRYAMDAEDVITVDGNMDGGDSENGRLPLGGDVPDQRGRYGLGIEDDDMNVRNDGGTIDHEHMAGTDQRDQANRDDLDISPHGNDLPGNKVSRVVSPDGVIRDIVSADDSEQDEGEKDSAVSPGDVTVSHLATGKPGSTIPPHFTTLPASASADTPMCETDARDNKPSRPAIDHRANNSGIHLNKSQTTPCNPAVDLERSNGTDPNDHKDATLGMEEGSLVTLGLIILAICVGLGLLCLFAILLGIYCRRRRQRNEQTQTPSTTATRNGSGNSGSTNQGSDSSRDLLASSLGIRTGHGYCKGAGHQTRLTYDSPFATLCKTDQFCQVDLDFPRPKQRRIPAVPPSDPDNSSLLYASHLDSRSNTKAVQVGHRGVDKIIPYSYVKPKRGRTIKQKSTNPETSAPRDVYHVNPYEFYSNVTICPVDCSPRSVYSTINPAHVTSPNTHSRLSRDHVTSADKPRDPGSHHSSRDKSKSQERSRESPGSKNLSRNAATSGNVPIATFYLNPDPVTCSMATSIAPVDQDAMKNRSLASMPEMSELFVDPESAYSPDIPDFISDESDWDTRSTISI